MRYFIMWIGSAYALFVLALVLESASKTAALDCYQDEYNPVNGHTVKTARSNCVFCIVSSDNFTWRSGHQHQICVLNITCAVFTVGRICSPIPDESAVGQICVTTMGSLLNSTKLRGSKTVTYRKVDEVPFLEEFKNNTAQLQ
ncbi:hypothetical protein EG68_08812 [Paragonimus skrjabini miyazakii]|uniref:Uncharacterized protein n=1 Tax=Paragonimus skrjabini miyazakii TaxID=59628 RepID=A0A8S9YUI4_9TREM|nr:hypothetical protein EG68_08812 [Paragonimus skrjabini miyazakii]